MNATILTLEQRQAKKQRKNANNTRNRAQALLDSCAHRLACATKRADYYNDAAIGKPASSYAARQFRAAKRALHEATIDHDNARILYAAVARLTANR